MGREVKRVHIDWDMFEREGNGTWKGYLLNEIVCPLCQGTKKNLKGKTCPQCYGEGNVCPNVEPSTGYDFEKTNGYQIWQDVSEGGPVSPVFMKPEDLAKWMVKNDNSVTRDTTYEGWLKFIESESSAPSMVMSGGNMESGVASLNNKSDETLAKSNVNEVKK